MRRKMVVFGLGIFGKFGRFVLYWVIVVCCVGVLGFRFLIILLFFVFLLRGWEVVVKVCVWC